MKLCSLQIRTLCLSPDGGLLLAIDVDGRSLLINKRRRVLLHHFSFKGPVNVARFSPDGQYIACAVGKILQVRLLMSPLHERSAQACVGHQASLGQCRTCQPTHLHLEIAVVGTPTKALQAWHQPYPLQSGSLAIL